MLTVQNLSSGYGGVEVLRDISFEVGNEVFAVLGANGAGKTTLLKTLANLLPVMGGEIVFESEATQALPPHVLPAKGIAYVPQEGNVFADLTVAENLAIGTLVGSRNRDERVAEVYGLFPRLAERRGQLAGSLSGGEGQMLAFGRALAQDPKVLLLDEPSAGLSPLLVSTLFEKIAEVRASRGMAIVLAEQNAKQTKELADRILVLSLGQVHLLDRAKSVSMKQLMDAYHI